MGDVEKKLAAIEPAYSRAPALPAKARPSLEALLTAVRSPDPAVREGAARTLGELGSVQAIPALRECLEDESKAVRSAAAVSLARLGDGALLAEMIKALADPSPGRVAGTALALGLSKRKEAVEPLLAAFKTHNTAIGSAVAGALGMIGDARAVEPLIEALKAGFVPTDACDALGRIGDRAAAPALVKALKHADDKIRARAARALGALKAALASPEAAEERGKAILAMRKLLADPNKKIRLAAALSLHELGDREASAQIVAVLRGM